MSQTENYPSTYLNLWEAICSLAYGVASENGGSEWREAKMAEGRQTDGEIEQAVVDRIVQEETDRFFWAVKMLKRAAKAEKIQVLGRRKHHSQLHPIPSMDFIHSGIDPLGDDGGGCLSPAEFTVDYDQRIWLGLQFKRAEIEEVRSVCRFVDPTATPPATTAQKYENWADRSQALHSQGETWKDAAETIALSDGVDPDHIAREVRRVRKTRERESGKRN